MNRQSVNDVSTFLVNYFLKLSFCFCILASSGPSLAEEGEWVLDAGLVLSLDFRDHNQGVRTIGGLELAASYHLSDSLSLGLRIEGGLELSAPEHLLFRPMLEASYRFDALSFIPYLSLGIGPSMRFYEKLLLDFAISPGLGVTYRPRREWSLSFETRYHALFPNLHSMFTAKILASFYFD